MGEPDAAQDQRMDQMFARANQLRAQGYDWSIAHGIAFLEHRVHDWPKDWGNDLRLLIYGDFAPPDSDLGIPELGICVRAEPKPNTLIKGAMTVLEATATIQEKTVPAVMDALRRVNVLLGSQILRTWGNTAFGWWCSLVHPSMGGVWEKFDASPQEVRHIIAGLLAYPPPMRQRLEAAMYWLREPRLLMMESYRSDILRRYVSYWNAFECLIEAVHIARPQESLSKQDRQAAIEKFFADRGGVSAQNVQDCFRTIIDTGFRGKASHALTMCFGDDADQYINECFALAKREDRLYSIRNAINHGDIDAQNPHELLRVEARLSRLWFIVWRMFGCFVPFSAPTETRT